jgi:hypothetical protein
LCVHLLELTPASPELAYHNQNTAVALANNPLSMYLVSETTKLPGEADCICFRNDHRQSSGALEGTTKIFRHSTGILLGYFHCFATTFVSFIGPRKSETRQDSRYVKYLNGFHQLLL